MHIVRIKCYGPVSDPSCPVDGAYLKSFDIEAFDGQGSAEFTEDAHEAIGFFTVQDAITVWYQQSRIRPLREDGKPNRPLSAFTAEFVYEELHEASTGMGGEDR